MTYFMKFAFTFFLTLVALGLGAQAPLLAQLEAGPITLPSSTTTAAAPVVVAGFPGGRAAFTHELSLHLNYPDLARAYAVEGTVVVRLKLDAKGRVTEKKVVRSLGFGCDEAALVALGKLPRWNAARRGNKRISGVVYVPLRFRLR